MGNMGAIDIANFWPWYNQDLFLFFTWPSITTCPPKFFDLPPCLNFQRCDYYFSSHIPSRHEREVIEFRKLEREKSFDEARTAVQSQIEKIFMKTAAATANNAKGKNASPQNKGAFS
jgi:hypothetical protein